MMWTHLADQPRTQGLLSTLGAVAIKDLGSGWSRDTPKPWVYRIAGSFVTLGEVSEGRNC